MKLQLHQYDPDKIINKKNFLIESPTYIKALENALDELGYGFSDVTE